MDIAANLEQAENLWYALPLKERIEVAIAHLRGDSSQAEREHAADVLAALRSAA